MMPEKQDDNTQALMEILRDRLGDRVDDFLIPPPVFITMQGEFVRIDLESAQLTTRFPVLESLQNPYGTMQGGMIAAAIDNTIGPLSFMVAPPNVTRSLEVKYSRPVPLDLGAIMVEARLVERHGKQLVFAADVRDSQGNRLARAKAVHWIISETPA